MQISSHIPEYYWIPKKGYQFKAIKRLTASQIEISLKMPEIRLDLYNSPNFDTNQNVNKIN